MMVTSIFVAPVTRGPIDYKIRMGIFVVVLFGTVFLQRRNNPRLLTVRLLQDNFDVCWKCQAWRVGEASE